jgi:hypothetical protein
MRWAALVRVLAVSSVLLARGAVPDRAGEKDKGPGVKDGADDADEDRNAATFRDTFKPKLAEGWTWLREDPAAWGVGAHRLEVRVQPGNMWGPANDAKNVLLRPAPHPSKSPVEVTAAVENKPTGQWEQVDLVWYYDDGHMVKLGQEMVAGQLSVVMGREQADRTQTIAIIPLDSPRVAWRSAARRSRAGSRRRTPSGATPASARCRRRRGRSRK